MKCLVYQNVDQKSLTDCPDMKDIDCMHPEVCITKAGSILRNSNSLALEAKAYYEKMLRCANEIRHNVMRVLKNKPQEHLADREGTL